MSLSHNINNANDTNGNNNNNNNDDNKHDLNSSNNNTSWVFLLCHAFPPHLPRIKNQIINFLKL